MKVKISISLDKQLVKEIEERAKANYRAMSNQIEVMLRHRLEEINEGKERAE